MSLDNRKVKILKAIISSYIDNAEAVGSRTISKKYELGVSPATIRNEMSDLEEMGFLVQPHTSSGRIPTDKAYRYYVDDLWKKLNVPSTKGTEELKKVIDEEAGQIEAIFKNSVRILSQFTKYTSFIVASQLKEYVIKRIQLIKVTDTKVLLLLILQNDIIKQVMIKLNKPIPETQMDKISSTLTEKLRGYKIEDINEEFKENLIKQFYYIRENSEDSLIELFPFLINQLEKIDDVNVYAEGITNILSLPEYNDLDKAREFISFIEDKKSIAKLIDNEEENDLAIIIGNENRYKQLRDCSLITATYKYNGKLIGKIGVIGPTRMDYQKVISSVKSISEAMNEIIKQNFIDENKE